MIVALKKVKIHPDMSEETNCFSAEVWIDGKKAGIVRNSGHGGPNEYDFDYLPLRAHAAKLYPNFSLEQEDILIDDLLQKWEEDAQLKQLKQWCKKQTIFRLKGDEPGCWRVIKHTFVPEVKADLQKLYGDELDEIANERFVTP